MFKYLAMAAVSVVALLSPSPAPSSQGVRPVSAPNVVVFMVDDATVEDIKYMPNVRRLLARHGTTFTRNYSPYPLCCPARVTFLTGQYPHNHGVLDNVAPLGGASVFDDSNTIATYLTDDYETAIVGKYLNNFRTLRYVPPGWDTWNVPVRGTTYNYMQQTMSMNGVLEDFDTFTTRHYGDLTRDFISSASGPYFAVTSFVAPHVGLPHENLNDSRPSAYVQRKYRGTYAGPPIPTDPTFNEAHIGDKRPAVADQPRLTPRQIAELSVKLVQRREALRSVDDQVALIMDDIAAAGELDDTYFIFVSDNGYMQGQHRILNGKSAAYEPASRVPLIIRGPGIPIAATYDDVTGLQDLTPTILSMTRQWRDQPVAQIDGTSLLALLAGRRTTRAQVIETVKGAKLSDQQVERGVTVSRRESRRLTTGGIPWDMRGIVTQKWKYTSYPLAREVEMYNLARDPYEARNLAGKRRYGVKEAHLAALYRRYRSCDGAECQ